MNTWLNHTSATRRCRRIEAAKCSAMAYSPGMGCDRRVDCLGQHSLGHEFVGVGEY